MIISFLILSLKKIYVFVSLSVGLSRFQKETVKRRCYVVSKGRRDRVPGKRFKIPKFQTCQILSENLFKESTSHLKTNTRISNFYPNSKIYIHTVQLDTLVIMEDSFEDIDDEIFLNVDVEIEISKEKKVLRR